MNTSKASEAIEEYVDRNYGDLITVGEPLYYKNQRFWTAELKSDYPRFIHDDKNPNATIVKYITLRHLGEVRLTHENHIEATPRNEVVYRVEGVLRQWRESVEEIILKSSADQLARISKVKDAFNPIVIAVDFFSREDTELFSYEDIRRDTHWKSLLKWFRFLSQIHILEEKDDGFGYGAKFAELHKQTGGKDMENRIISYVMREHYISMKQLFEIDRFDPFLHLEACYYSPCLQAGGLLYRKEETLLETYHRWYPPLPDWRLRPVLAQLEEVELLHKKSTPQGVYWYGSETTWKSLCARRKEVPQELAPIKA